MIGPTEQVGHPGAGGLHSDADPAMRFLQLPVEHSDVVEQLPGHLEPGLLGGRGGVDPVEDPLGLGGIELLPMPPGANSMTTLWSRHTTRVRWLPMSMFRFAASRRISV
jgi:hypothetical protein